MEPRTTNVRSPLSLGLSHHQHQQQQLMGGGPGSGNNLDYLSSANGAAPANNGGVRAPTGPAGVLDIPRNSSNDLRLTSPGPSNDILTNNNNSASANDHILASANSAGGGQPQHHQPQQGLLFKVPIDFFDWLPCLTAESVLGFTRFETLIELLY